MEASPSPGRPLAGIRVLDLTSVLLGPYATQIMGDHGADVVKVEAPSGDSTRKTGPAREPGMSAMFIGANRGKRSVVLDLKQPAAREALLCLADRADVLIHAMRPQKMVTLGLGPEVLRARNRRLIVVAAYGFAEGGPYSGRPAYDDIIQGLSGMAGLAERMGDEPCYVPSVIADKTCGLFAVQAMLMALVGRARDGMGSYVEVPMFEAMVGFNWVEHGYGAQFEPPLGPPGYDRLLTRWRRPFKTLDGYVCMMPYTDAHWQRFLVDAGRPELVSDPRFTGMAARTLHIDEVYSILNETVAQRSTGEWLTVCDQLDIPASRLNRMEDLLDDPHLRATRFFKTVADPVMGSLRMPRPALRFGAHESEPRIPPRLGEHTGEVLKEAGLDAGAIDALFASGAAVQYSKEA
jgi:crotonobetainyl-CoA:carnitine CoA-transferase CaiB-like acyl-CoA transferase